MNSNLDKALKNWDFMAIAELNGRKEVKMPTQIKVLYTPTKYQIKVRRGNEKEDR